MPRTSPTPLTAEVLRVQGRGTPLAYLPGVDGCGELLYGTAERLGPSFHLACLRYAGTSGGYPELAAEVVRLLNGLGFARPLVLAESFGVGLALTLALEYPERVAGLALVNGFAHYQRAWRVVLSEVFAAHVPGALLRPCRRAFGWRTLMAPRRDAHALELLLARRIEFDASYRARLRLSRMLDLRERLREIRVPVALFASDQDHIVDSVPAARLMAERLPDAELTILPRAGHVVLPLTEEPWPERLERLAARAGMRPGEG